jgi:plastocyanin
VLRHGSGHQEQEFHMKKLLLSAAAFALLLIPACSSQPPTPPSGGTTHTVNLELLPIEGQQVPQFFFEPTGLLIEPGDTVKFVWKAPHHTVTSYSEVFGKTQRIPASAKAFSSPVVAIDGSWSHTFTTAGTYDLWCAPHEMYGMAMRIIVGEPGGPGNTQVTDFGPDGAFGAAGTVLNDPALSAANIIAKGKAGVPWADISDEAKAGPSPTP